MHAKNHAHNNHGHHSLSGQQVSRDGKAVPYEHIDGIQRAHIVSRLLTPAEVLQLQRVIGNRAVSQLFSQAARHQPIEKKGWIQRFGTVRFANVNQNKPQYAEKAADIVDTLQHSPVIQHFLRNKNALITLDFNLQNLASVRVDGEQVQISLSPWFFEQESRGKIIGMLAHEFGIHPVATDLMTPAEINQEAQDRQNQTPLATGVGTDTINYDGGNQADHIFGAIQGNPRHTHYQETAYSMVSTMLANQATTHITNAHITDVMMSYLADVAMILGTNDHRGKTPFKLQRTAQYFNHLRQAWITFLALKPDGPALTPLVPPQQTASSVTGEIFSISGSFVLSMFTSSKSDEKAQHTQVGGGLSPVTTNQAEIIGDYNLVLQPITIGGASPSFLNALDDAQHVPTGTYRQLIRQHILAAGSPQNLQQLDTKLLNNQLTSPISNDEHYSIANLLGLTIRIIDSNGKMTTRGFGPMRTLLDVRKPNPHYRFAQ